MTENETNIFPKFDLFPRITRVVHFLFDHFQSEGISDHANKGGGPMLDEMIDVPESTQLMLDYWTLEE